jgi:hypothetical protein
LSWPRADPGIDKEIKYVLTSVRHLYYNRV